ncbi:MAG: UDP-N-acetylmuramoyl-L-alanine--D-glutamate ligase [Bacteroidetes bacterium]|nr:MAG: UDP-N-acetylmuramoyl-L-alanine--D-glutamate ligase [Bacteroidota bacterium]REK03489.1 MAG: UDP-N-acetylmuramoyl-L-alanine--D-glutamate ligase [Bacteroidota bacterium]REK34794.1 MAG: UDP-N-acetylmuramoyl-L-alanine--D-glutamate ligase [Bacteroidota bacterium]REK51327.1 MAG: UDP-N-acetylmuramoyl-L-alanine--D-glutamate ligase [Bacteroidota bacterium]
MKESKDINGPVVILGAAESGVGAAILATKLGLEVFVSDSGSIKDNYKKQLNHHRISFEENGHSSDRIHDSSVVIKSPGIPDNNSLVISLRERGIPVISEIEFAGKYTDAKMIGITGTNGKTTTTLLTYHILNKAGLNVGLAGNVGKSLALQVAESSFDYYVLELSSFQLDGMYSFKCDVAVLTNITPDHLDRYDYKLENYARSKFKITNNQGPDDSFIYCADDPITHQYMMKEEIKSHMFPFSIKKKLEEGAWLENDQLIIHTHKQHYSMLIHELALQGKHNLYNSMAAGISARVLEIRKEIVRESLSDFKNVEHRLEHVATVHGIDFVNDSKATNVNSTWYALESFNRPVILILGGVDKGNDYSMLAELVKEKVKGIVCLGKDNKKIRKAFAEQVSQIVETETADAAVKAAYAMGKKGDVVLLSPACASFDLFENYEDRGRQFKIAVKSL